MNITYQITIFKFLALKNLLNYTKYININYIKMHIINSHRI